MAESVKAYILENRSVARRLEDWFLTHDFRHRGVVEKGDLERVNPQTANGEQCLTLIDDQRRVVARVVFNKLAVRIERWTRKRIFLDRRLQLGHGWERIGSCYYANLTWDKNGVPRGIGIVSYLSHLIAHQRSYLVPNHETAEAEGQTIVQKNEQEG